MCVTVLRSPGLEEMHEPGSRMLAVSRSSGRQGGQFDPERQFPGLSRECSSYWLEMLDYGVLKGPVVDFGREDDGRSPHFQIVVKAGNNRFRVPVNVKSTDSSTVLFSIVEPLINHRLIAELPQLAEGFTAKGTTGTAFLDYVREPIFDITAMRTLPPTVPGPDNDLQDFITHKVEIARRDNRLLFAFGRDFRAVTRFPPIVSSTPMAGCMTFT